MTTYSQRERRRTARGASWARRMARKRHEKLPTRTSSSHLSEHSVTPPTPPEYSQYSEHMLPSQPTIIHQNEHALAESSAADDAISTQASTEASVEGSTVTEALFVSSDSEGDHISMTSAAEEGDSDPDEAMFELMPKRPVINFMA